MPEPSPAPKPTPGRSNPLTYVYRHGEGKEQASKSRCCHSTGAPYSWHCYYPATNPELGRFRTWFAGLPPVVQDIIFAELEVLFDAAAGGLTDPHDDDEPIKNIRRQDGFYELRAFFNPEVEGEHGQHFRHYHYEPAEPWNKVLLALHAHLKDTEGPRAEVAKRQDQQIKFAITRCDLGRSKEWGLPADNEELVERLLDL